MKSPAEDLIKLFLRSDEEQNEDEQNSGVVTFSVRSPVERLAKIGAMSKHIGVSRNEMANQLIEIGMNSVLSALPDELRIQLLTEAGESL